MRVILCLTPLFFSLWLFVINAYAFDAKPESSEIDNGIKCDRPAERLHLIDEPYQNYFYSDCNSASQVVVTSPLPSSDPELISPRLLVAWPAGNSGLVAFFSPANGNDGTLSLKLIKSGDADEFLHPFYRQAGANSLRDDPNVGVQGVIRLNSSAVMDLAILGSVRSMRDYTEGGGVLAPDVQNGIEYRAVNDGKGELLRTWFDNKTTTHLVFTPLGSADDVDVDVDGKKLTFGSGDYRFRASFDYPQLNQLEVTDVLNPASQDLIKQQPDRTKSLAFLSYKGKLLAGAWRFLTYFGRDSMISMLLLQPVLSVGKGSATEAVISAVLERVNHTTGAVCHEETIGDYATYLNMQSGEESTKPICSYIMIDSDYYLPIVMDNYFVKTKAGKKRTKPFFNQDAVLNFGNRGVKYSELAEVNAERIMKYAARFAGAQGSQTKANLRHLEAGQIVGQWRDSGYGIGGGRIPFDVNTALVPAALRAIGSLSRNGFFSDHPRWGKIADEYAKIWEDETLHFFSVSVPQSEAKSLVRDYVSESNFQGPTKVSTIDHDVNYHGLALDGNNGQSIVKVMNTDVAFRLFLLNTTNDAQLTPLLKQTSQQILMPFPAGLSTDVGLVVANPAYGGAPVYAQNFTRSDYHGTVVWGWQLAMMAKGLEQQLARCIDGASDKPGFCTEQATHQLVKRAYNNLWDAIDQNEKLLSLEVWSWEYNVQQKKFEEVDLGVLSATESDIRQLWSLSFLAVKRSPLFES